MNRATKLLACVAACVLAGTPAAWAAGRVAVFHFDGPLLERPQGDMMFAFGAQPDTLKDLIQRFEKANDDPAIEAILITVGSPAMGMAQIEEVSEAIAESEKPVYVHVDVLNTGLYALVSTATHISVTPTGDVWILGFYSETPYLKRLLGNLRLDTDFIHIGDYKSAGEMLYRDGPSDAAKENMNWLLDGLYGRLVHNIATARFNGDDDKVRSIINGGPYTAEDALKVGLIDSVMHRQDLVADLKARHGDDLTFVRNYGEKSGPDLDTDNPFAAFQMLMEMFSGKPQSTKTAVAVVYVEGAIMPGAEQNSPFGGENAARSTTIRRALDEAADDPSVEAVVLRVDSPGGSALASEIIYDATQRVRAAGKPLVVSMGNVAASGGYYVSCGADSIYADPTTITASIGVVGGKIITTGMWDWMGVTWHAYQRGEMAGMMSTSRKWNETERTKIENWMEEIYGIFKGHIVDHRGEKLTKSIDEMAGGRVYTGAQALELGLVDKLGTMDDAVTEAAKMASISDYELRVLPRPKTIFDLLREGMGGEETDQVRVQASELFGAGSPLLEAVLPALENLDPQRAEILQQSLIRLQLMHEENVILMMPQDLLIGYR